MKGRLTYSQVNGAIDELNKPLKEKYKILSMKRTTLNDINRKRYEKFKLQETKDTAGLLSNTTLITIKAQTTLILALHHIAKL